MRLTKLPIMQENEGILISVENHDSHYKYYFFSFLSKNKKQMSDNERLITEDISHIRSVRETEI